MIYPQGWHIGPCSPRRLRLQLSPLRTCIGLDGRRNGSSRERYGCQLFGEGKFRSLLGPPWSWVILRCRYLVSFQHFCSSQPSNDFHGQPAMEQRGLVRQRLVGIARLPAVRRHASRDEHESLRRWFPDPAAGLVPWKRQRTTVGHFTTLAEAGRYNVDANFGLERRLYGVCQW